MTFSEKEIEQLKYIFFPHNTRKEEQAKKNNTRLVHYCSAQSAMKIFRSKKFWMRNSKCMNDFDELGYGLDCLNSCWGKKDGISPIKGALDQIFPNLSDEIQDLFNNRLPDLKDNTYISCFSEHYQEEDTIGRLSMWRAYGNPTSVALVMNSDPFLSESDDFEHIYTSSVAYFTHEEVKQEIENISKGLIDNKDFLKNLGKDVLIYAMFNALKFTMICNKHPGFKEEQEWRVIYCPTIEKNNNISKSIEVCDGLPQPVYNIPLKLSSDDEGTGVVFNDLVDRVIIGPTEYPEAAKLAFIDLLREANIHDAENKVFNSHIPLRT